MAETFYKQPREEHDYFVDMDKYFEQYDGDYIESDTDIAIEIEPAGALQMDSIDLVGNPAYGFNVWLSGGVDGGRYKVTCLVTTAQTRVEEIEFYVRVKET